MKRYFLPLFLNIFPVLAFAEGACPPGFYPIGGQGASGCAPIASENSNVPQPTGEWKARWGALARSQDNSVLGVAAKEHSKSAAKKNAIKACMEVGGVNCKVKVFYKNSCIAQAQSTQLGKFNTFNDNSKELAESNALRDCGHADCVVGYSDCSKAEFHEY
ncbi:hypothetical protein FHR55_002011 [Xanthomonas arboricola]